jgi:hypothetical protein
MSGGVSTQLPASQTGIVREDHKEQQLSRQEIDNN